MGRRERERVSSYHTSDMRGTGNGQHRAERPPFGKQACGHSTKIKRCAMFKGRYTHAWEWAHSKPKLQAFIIRHRHT